MRKWAVTILAMSVLAVAATPSGARPPRKAGLEYKIEDENHHVAGPNFNAGVWNEEDAYAFPVKKGERFISVSIADEREEPVHGVIVQWVWDYESDGAKVGHAATHVSFCGETEKPVEIQPDITVEILLEKGTCQDGTPSLPTNGHIFAKFYRGKR
jgi:hypothetical protein